MIKYFHGGHYFKIKGEAKFKELEIFLKKHFTFSKSMTNKILDWDEKNSFTFIKLIFSDAKKSDFRDIEPPKINNR